VILRNGIFVIDGLGWVEEMMGWVGLGYENWTHGHVCGNIIQASTRSVSASLHA